MWLAGGGSAQLVVGEHDVLYNCRVSRVSREDEEERVYRGYRNRDEDGVLPAHVVGPFGQASIEEEDRAFREAR